MLGSERVGVNDSFFELGGHSLLIMRIVGRLKRTMGVEITLKQFFDQPTVAELSAYIDTIKEQKRKAEMLEGLDIEVIEI